MTLKERIAEYCQTKGLSISQFERLAGLSNGYFKESSQLPRAAKRAQILRAFPDINPNWLVTGEGPMLIENDGTTPTDNKTIQTGCTEETIAKLSETVERQSRQIERLLNMVEHLQRKQNVKEQKEL